MSSGEESGRSPASDSRRKSGAAAEVRTVGKYEILRKLGSGGMGTVYLARDTVLNREVALKVLPRDKAIEPNLVKRFQAEAQAAANLKHENIVAIYEAGEIDGQLYISLEYLPGTDVHNLVARRGTLPIKRSIEIIKQVATALKHAFERGIVHRDIKPSNLLISREGVVKLTDMGLARSIDESLETGITRAGTTVGTVDYMAPEQARNSKAADIRSDIYSLGCTWYEMLTGVPPFPEGSLTNKLFAHVTANRPDPRDKNPHVPEGVVVVLHKMMSRKPADRYQTPDELLVDLAHLETAPDGSTLPSLATIPIPGPDVATQILSDMHEQPTELMEGAGAAEDPTGPKLARSDKPLRKHETGPMTVAGIPVIYLGIGGAFVTVAILLGVLISRFSEGFNSEGIGPENPFQKTNRDDPNSPNVTTTNPRNQNTPAGTQTNTNLGKNTPIQGNPHIITQGRDAGGRTPEKQWQNLPFGREGERQFVPVWVTQLWPFQPQPDLPVMNVGRVQDGMPGQFVSLQEALLQVPEEGAEIRLIGKGPFLLTPTDLPRCNQLIISGSPEDRPLITFQSHPDFTGNTLLKLQSGSLALFGVNLILPAEQFPQADPLSVVEVSGGDLSVQSSTLTVLGKRSARTTWFQVGTPPGGVHAGFAQLRDPHVLIKDSYFRGHNMTAVQVHHEKGDVLAYNSLFLTRGAPLFRWSHGEISKPQAAKQSVTRFLSFLSCCGSMDHSLVELEAPADGPAPSTEIITVNSIFGTPFGAENPVLLTLKHWPLKPGTEDMIDSLKWDLESSLILGWTKLVALEGTSLEVISPMNWDRFWGAPVQHAQFAKTAFPKAPLENLDELPASILTPQTVSVPGVSSTDNGQPGVENIEQFSVPSESMMKQYRGWVRRPVPPENLVQPGSLTVTNRVEIDLNKEDLGRKIASTPWPSGTEFVISGTRLCYTSPIVVKDKSLRIVFQRKSSNETFELLPRPVDPAQDGGEALFRIENGTLQIVDGNIRFPSSKNQPTPRWFLEAVNANFSIINTRVEGPLLERNRYKGMIHWVTTQTDPIETYRHYGYIDRSFLLGHGTIVEADLRWQALDIRNSVIVALERMIDARIVSDRQHPQGAIALDRCTLSAAETFFYLNAEFLNPPAQPPLELFASRCLFLDPILSEPNQKPPFRLITHGALSKPARDFEWWGQSNGFTQSLSTWIVSEKEPSPTGQSFTANWLNLWEDYRISRPLTKPGAVMLQNNLPKYTELKASKFQLHKAVAASTWSEMGNPIGANVSAIQPLSTTAPESQPQTPSNTPIKPGF